MLKSGQLTAFTVSELFRDKQQEGLTRLSACSITRFEKVAIDYEFFQRIFSHI